MPFLKAFAFMLLMAIGIGVGLVIMVKGTGLLSMVPFFGALGVGTWAFAKWGCLSQGDH